MTTLAAKIRTELSTMLNNSSDFVTRELVPRLAVSYISGVIDTSKL